MDAHYKGSSKIWDMVSDINMHMIIRIIMLEQQYLPDELVGSKFYNPGDLGYEAEVKEYFKKIRGID